MAGGSKEVVAQEHPGSWMVRSKKTNDDCNPLHSDQEEERQGSKKNVLVIRRKNNRSVSHVSRQPLKRRWQESKQQDRSAFRLKKEAARNLSK